VAMIVVCLASSATMFAQETGMVINGVKWATCNVDAPGTFAEKPESPGMFYQWNRNIAWAATGNIAGWNSSNPNGTIWEKSNDPSPAGWRVPTFEEIEHLLDKEKVTNEYIKVNDVWGNRFTDKETGNSIFIPFVGNRINPNGSIDTMGSGYWSSTQDAPDSASALLLVFNQAVKSASKRNNGLLVRCVAE